MGLDIIVPGVTFSNYVDISAYPVTTNLSSLYYLGVDANTSKTNQIPGGGADATVGANVTFAAGYATFSGDPTAAANFIQTNDLDSASTDFTRIAIFQKMDTTDRPVWGQWNSGVSGSGFLQTLSHVVASGPTLVSRTLYGSAAQTAFVFVAQKYTGGVLSTYTANGGVLAAAVTNSAASRVTNSAVAERIGGSAGSAVFSGTSRIAMVSKHRSALTDAQIADIFNFCKLVMTKRGLVLS
ncbi:hypothetical protein AQZ52_10970 [Novosphingobium fuchskuhlense]|uniref:Uncharacterized protein n=1 Tax=Novosphingobium fuchskuhlense TaxID=1117702 RepID=A0A117UUP9_9SPHN|nr:hypothetical protein [Novosphingobium fuchskuhlense]KUR71185.1 hypothetical protein AQZ52_10970 [Novosphingobium fuchskuhlense]